MKKQNKHLPFTRKEYNLIRDKDLVIEGLIQSGLRASAFLDLINIYRTGDTRLQVYSKGKNYVVYLNSKAQNIIAQIKEQKLTKDWDRFKLRRYIKKKVFEFGILREDITTHTTRATYATTLLEEGVDLVIVQTLMNHNDVSTTAKYIAINEDLLASSVETMTRKNTFEGMSRNELVKEVTKLRRRLRKLEEVK